MWLKYQKPKHEILFLLRRNTPERGVTSDTQEEHPNSTSTVLPVTICVKRLTHGRQMISHQEVAGFPGI